MSTIRRERLCLWLSLLVNMLMLGGFIGLMGKWKLLESELARERRERAELALRPKETDASPNARAANEAARADADQLELARLRNEVTRLRGEVRAAATTTNAPAPRRAAPVAPATSPAPVPSVRQLSAQVSVQLPLGQTLALGGWVGERPGERIVGFMTPSTDPAAPGAVLVQSHLISVPDRLLDRLGLQAFRTEENASQAAAALDPARFAALLKFAEGENGVSVLSAPRVLTSNGQAAQISVRQAQPDGSEIGPLLKLTPTLDAAGANVRLDVGVELNLAPARQP